jgi:hypothetical protein
METQKIDEERAEWVARLEMEKSGSQIFDDTDEE